MENQPVVVCPNCSEKEPLSTALTAQSNQNVIYECSSCHFIVRNIETSKG
jgi:DNA-directed RNA polymerase subunit RPC12/RpoP